MAERLTVIIPTRERHDTLRWALKTCVSQDFDRLRLVALEDLRPVLRAVFRAAFRAVFLAPLRAPLRVLLRGGTFPPSFRASLRPIAIACLRLVTLRPDPLLSVPFFVRDTADFTRFDAVFPYFAMLRPPNGDRETACLAPGAVMQTAFSFQPCRMLVVAAAPPDR